MPLSALFRTALAFRLSPLFVVAMFGGFQGEPGWPEPYGLAATSHAEAAIWLLAPLAGMCAAWEGYRLRRAGWLEQPRGRSLVTVVGWSIAPVIVVSWATFLAGVVVEVLPLMPDLRVTVLGLLLLLGWVVLGFGVGLVTHAIVGLPTMMVAGYCWFSLPSAFEPVWMRHVTGELGACCSVETDLAPAVLAAAGTVALGLALSGAVLIRSNLPSRGATWRALSPVPLIAALAISTPMINDLGPVPAVKRDVSMECAGSAPAVCVYPERDGILNDIVSVASDSYEVWEDRGFTGPARLSEDGRAFPGAPPLHTYTGWGRPQLTRAVVEAAVPRSFRRCDVDRRAARRSSRGLSAWLALTAGLDRSEVRAAYGKPAFDVAAPIASLPERRQRAWVARKLATFGQCRPDAQQSEDAG